MRDKYKNRAEILGVDVRCKETLDNFQKLDVINYGKTRRLIREFQPRWVLHLPAILSAAAEQDIKVAHQAVSVNVYSFYNMLRLAQEYGFRLFCPSSIAVFGLDRKQKANIPEDILVEPPYLYGITKHFNEKLGEYFSRKYGTDYRAIRLPGILASEASLGVGTTDYAISMIRLAANSGSGQFRCKLNPKTVLPMVHIEDCVEGIIKLMCTPRSSLSRCVYNINALSFDPQTLHTTIEKITGRHLTVTYDNRPDQRQAIADTWPHSLDDRNAQRDWGWTPKYCNLHKTIQSILHDLSSQ